MLLENIKRIADGTGSIRPYGSQVLLRERKPHTRLFKDDGVIPNHPRWPLVIYKSAVRLPGALDPAAVFEDLFRANGWGKSWRDSIYKYAHYHSRIHEFSALRAAAARCNSAELEDALSTSRQETWQSFRRARATNA